MNNIILQLDCNSIGMDIFSVVNHAFDFSFEAVYEFAAVYMIDVS